MPRKDQSSAKVEEHIGFGGKNKQYIVLRFFDADKHPFMITLARAHLILKHYEEMKAFVASQETPSQSGFQLGKTLEA